jgi:hypothetical protein
MFRLFVLREYVNRTSAVLPVRAKSVATMAVKARAACVVQEQLATPAASALKPLGRA